MTFSIEKTRNCKELKKFKLAIGLFLIAFRSSGPFFVADPPTWVKYREWQILIFDRLIRINTKTVKKIKEKKDENTNK